MKFNFRNIATINALILFSLALIWMFAPNIFLSMWGVDYTYAVGMLSRRGAATYAGVSVMLFWARNAPPSHIRSALVAGFGVACFILATLGVIEFVTGHARIEILIAVFIEASIAMSLWYANKAKAVR